MLAYIMLLCLWSDLNYICSGIIGAVGIIAAPTNRFYLYKSIFRDG
jgi:hypothetical protein